MLQEKSSSTLQNLLTKLHPTILSATLFLMHASLFFFSLLFSVYLVRLTNSYLLNVQTFTFHSMVPLICAAVAFAFLLIFASVVILMLIRIRKNDTEIQDMEKLERYILIVQTLGLIFAFGVIRGLRYVISYENSNLDNYELFALEAHRNMTVSLAILLGYGVALFSRFSKSSGYLKSIFTFLVIFPATIIAGVLLTSTSADLVLGFPVIPAYIGNQPQFRGTPGPLYWLFVITVVFGLFGIWVVSFRNVRWITFYKSIGFYEFLIASIINITAFSELYVILTSTGESPSLEYSFLLWVPVLTLTEIIKGFPPFTIHELPSDVVPTAVASFSKLEQISHFFKSRIGRTILGFGVFCIGLAVFTFIGLNPDMLPWFRDHKNYLGILISAAGLWLMLIWLIVFDRWSKDVKLGMLFLFTGIILQNL